MRDKIKKINFFKVFGVTFFEVKEKSFIMLLKFFLASILKKFDHSILKHKEIDFLFVKSQDRKDYNWLYEKIYSQCSYKKYDFSLKRSYGINFFFLKNSVSNLELLYIFVKKSSLSEGLFIYFKAISYLEILNILDNVNYKHLIVFSDVQPVENLMVQYSNLRGINTVTMQHGLYIDYNNFPNINMLNYIDVSSKYLLAWGETTEKLFNKYNPSIKVEICGKPLEKKQKKSNSNIHETIGVVFDIPLFKEFNKKLLLAAYEIAKKRKMKVIVKLHPQDSIENYTFDNTLMNNSNSLEDSSYILAHTTSMIYELLVLGQRVYKLRSGIPANTLNDDLIFSTVEELEDKISNDFNFVSEAKKHIKYIGEESNDRYRKFFEKLIEDS
ncbi:hypothetical protein BKP45_03210 [Anaerobacillus alkalidiazotrophicus]|uniref:CDP-glycerol--glycerophosphate glycerophosphotransferase n=1 Tax=Anaerobacillus alkalidiazotrophicus TaxID=472963 RepID=A0A1S2MAC3_9BACI|nr:hypothetical protein [Anaerobacillus alkalidiazotrophicus]OIJ21722.1 hypothetical protein BKP45_03210 [Anaerobacillus alkalidiazotrophicus]